MQTSLCRKKITHFRRRNRRGNRRKHRVGSWTWRSHNIWSWLERNRTAHIAMRRHKQCAGRQRSYPRDRHSTTTPHNRTSGLFVSSQRQHICFNGACVHQGIQRSNWSQYDPSHSKPSVLDRQLIFYVQDSQLDCSRSTSLNNYSTFRFQSAYIACFWYIRILITRSRGRNYWCSSGILLWFKNRPSPCSIYSQRLLMAQPTNQPTIPSSRDTMRACRIVEIYRAQNVNSGRHYPSRGDACSARKQLG